MANELNISLGQIGQTVIARIYSAGAQVGTDIALIEIANQGGYYTGSMPAISAATYDVQFFVNGSLRGSGTIVWDGTQELTVANVSGGSAPTVIQIRQEMDSNSTKLVNLDTTISSRLAATSYVAAPTVIQVRQEMDSNSSKLANLDAAVSSRLAAGSYSAPPTAAQIRTEMDANSTKLANLDAAVSSRLAAVAYVSPPSASSIAAVAATVLFVDGATNQLKVNSDHSVNATGGSSGTIANYITVPAAIAAASQSPSVITCLRGDTLRVALPAMGDISTRSKLIFTAKAQISDADDQSVFQIIEGVGLTRLNGLPVSLVVASLTVVDATTGAANLQIDASVTAQFAVTDLVWDAQAFLTTGISSPISGTFSVVADVTRTVT